MSNGTFPAACQPAGLCGAAARVSVAGVAVAGDAKGSVVGWFFMGQVSFRLADPLVDRQNPRLRGLQSLFQAIDFSPQADHDLIEFLQQPLLMTEGLLQIPHALLDFRIWGHHTQKLNRAGDKSRFGMNLTESDRSQL
jgi:hypothetical protein